VCWSPVFIIHPWDSDCLLCVGEHRKGGEREAEEWAQMESRDRNWRLKCLVWALAQGGEHVKC
jgi:hypothetical protein